MVVGVLVDMLLEDAAPHRKPLHIARAWFELYPVTRAAVGPAGAALGSVGGREVLFVSTDRPAEALAYFVARKWLGAAGLDDETRDALAEILGEELCKRSQEDAPSSRIRVSVG